MKKKVFKKLDGIKTVVQERKLFFLVGAAVVVAAGILFYFFYLQNPRFQVLAEVNGTKITVKKFNQNIEKTVEQLNQNNTDKTKVPVIIDILKEQSDKILEEMIRTELFLEAAKKEGLSPLPKTFKDTEKDALSPEISVIRQFLQKKFPTPPVVTREEIQQVYDHYKGQMPGVSLKEATPGIEEALRTSKQQKAFEQLYNELRQNATITVNQKLLQKITTHPPKTNTREDLQKALTGGKPTLVDFGSNYNPHCRFMRPTLNEISKEYSKKMKVLVIEADQNQDLAAENKIERLPTLVFFNAKGQEFFRQVGPMEKDKIVAKLKEMGVE